MQETLLNFGCKVFCEFIDYVYHSRILQSFDTMRLFLGAIYVALFVVKDDDESETTVQQATSTSHSLASLQPAEIFAANSSTVSF